MKSLRDISLKHWAVGLLLLLFLILVAEYFVIRIKLTALEDVEQKEDFVRRAQLSGQQLDLAVQRYLISQHELAPEISTRLSQQDHLISILRHGGRIDGTAIFLKPLSRLPKISFENLEEAWKNYREGIQLTLLEPAIVTSKTLTNHKINDSTKVDSVSAISATADTVQRDSVQHSTGLIKGDLQLAKAKALLPGQWLTLSSWHDKLIIDLKEEETEKDSALFMWFIIFIVGDLGFLIGLYLLFNYFILIPIQALEINTANKTSINHFPQNELGTLAHHINDILEQLKNATEFVVKIGEGNFQIDYKELDQTYTKDKNKLADSLIAMQQKLKSLNDEEQKRQWSNEGLGKFVDILRSSNDNIQELGDTIISALVQYTHSNQGALYILNDESEKDLHLELISLFAFESKKYENRKLKLGEGILGQTFLEKETTYLNEIPENYIRISSGLGDANPTAILMVPLKVDKEIYGIVELASFKPYQPYEIAFIEKLGETIASTLASVKSAQRNRYLIEQFQEQTEIMRAQEEEMRQNFEELQATQEELSRKERSYVIRIEELEQQAPSSVIEQALVNLKREMEKKETENKIKIEDLEQRLLQNTTEGQWTIAAEVEKNLKINLEALKITQHVLENKARKD